LIGSGANWVAVASEIARLDKSDDGRIIGATRDDLQSIPGIDQMTGDLFLRPAKREQAIGDAGKGPNLFLIESPPSDRDRHLPTASRCSEAVPG